MEMQNESEIVSAETVSDSSPIKRSSWILLMCFGLAGICCCGGFGGIATFVIRMGGDEDAAKVSELVRNHPMVMEKLGGIQECKKDFAASLSEGGKRTDVFDVRGPKGKAQFITFQLFYEFRFVKLRTDEGEWEFLEDGPEPGGDAE